MNVDFSIIPECYADTTLIETISPPQRGYNHQKGCGNVARTMQNKLKDSFAVGIIDRDKKEIKYLHEFEKVNESGDLCLFKHPERHHYIIQISPAIEKFILRSAGEVGIEPKTFGIPDEFEQLKKITKRKISGNDPSLRDLFLELKNKKAPQIVTLSNWISYLKANTYRSNLEEIKNIQ